MDQYGADTIRCLWFLRHQHKIDWSDGAVEGCFDFSSVWTYAHERLSLLNPVELNPDQLSAQDRRILIDMHKGYHWSIETFMQYISINWHQVLWNFSNISLELMIFNVILLGSTWIIATPTCFKLLLILLTHYGVIVGLVMILPQPSGRLQIPRSWHLIKWQLWSV